MDKADPIRLEVLRMARELVINEHTDRRAELHNQWLVNSEAKWQSHRQRVPYPPIPPYPTEADILARAQVLFHFLNGVAPAPVMAAAPEPAVETCEPTGPTGPQPAGPCEPTGPTGPTAPTGLAQEHGARDMGEQPRPPKGPPDDDAKATGSTAGEASQPPRQGIEEMVAYASAKVSRDLDDQSTTASRLMPNVMKKLDDIRRGWNS